LVGIPVYKCARDSPVAMVRRDDCCRTVGRALYLFVSSKIGEVVLMMDNK
jgi:hypothetical protein